MKDPKRVSDARRQENDSYEQKVLQVVRLIREVNQESLDKTGWCGCSMVASGYSIAIRSVDTVVWCSYAGDPYVPTKKDLLSLIRRHANKILSSVRANRRKGTR